MKLVKTGSIIKVQFGKKVCVLGGLLLTALLVPCVADKESKPAKRHPNRGQYLKGALVTCTFTLADVILQTSVIKNLV